MPTLWKGEFLLKLSTRTTERPKKFTFARLRKPATYLKLFLYVGTSKEISSGTDNLSVSILAKQVTHISWEAQTKGLTWGPCPWQSACVSGADNPHQHRASSLLVFYMSHCRAQYFQPCLGQEYPTPKLNWLPQALKTASTSYWMSRRLLCPSLVSALGWISALSAVGNKYTTCEIAHTSKYYLRKLYSQNHNIFRALKINFLSHLFFAIIIIS